MKVAVCVSGAFVTKSPKGNLITNNKILKHMFPGADFYYATWDQYESSFNQLFPNDTCQYFPEPTPHYHPYTDIQERDHISSFYKDTVAWSQQDGKKRLDWTSHHVKQILIHSWMIESIKEKYDVIVRTRFDAYVSKNANFEQYIHDTFENKRANCFGATKPERFDTLVDVDMNIHPLHTNWLLDPIIIHPANAIDTKLVNTLYENKRLHAAEYGWYQIISRPHGSKHRSFSGWVNADCRVLDKFWWRL